MDFDIERNALAGETSPYLRQHADNPVNWQTWNPQALACARQQDRPILLSIGYAACHWCHVMAHESFTDCTTAALMNQHFVNIKVDREERPDLDKIYQTAHQLLMRRPGGWPLTAFLTPSDQAPFFIGTYFPPQAHHHLPSFRQLLGWVTDVYIRQRDQIVTQNRSLSEALQGLEPTLSAAGATPSGAVLDTAQQQLLQSIDHTHGGFGGAPKFPQPMMLERLLRHHALVDGGDEAALKAVLFSFHCMVDSGFHDQLGGGFYRYAVDHQWMIPHFEKMLYDNAQLLQLGCHLHTFDSSRRCAVAIRKTADWVMREMQSPEGGYWSALDADSEGVEGKFYVWTASAAQAALAETEWRLLARRFGLDRAPNFEGKYWHLHGFTALSQIAEEHHLAASDAAAILDRACAKLLALREQRIRPGLDNKILTAWNGLMIKAMAKAARALAEPRYLQSAERAMRFVRQRQWSEQRLFAVNCDQQTRFPAYLDDYAIMLDAMLELLCCRFDAADLAFAMALAEALLLHFEDPDDGGFFFTSHDHEALLQRTKPLQDDALPAGNGVAAYALQRLGHLLGEPRYLSASKRAIALAQQQLEKFPSAHSALLCAQEEYLHPPQTIVLRGTGEELRRWRHRAQHCYAPHRQVLAIPNNISCALPGLLVERTPADNGGVIAYVCQGHRCEVPIQSFDAFEQALQATEIADRAG